MLSGLLKGWKPKAYSNFDLIEAWPMLWMPPPPPSAPDGLMFDSILESLLVYNITACLCCLPFPVVVPSAGFSSSPSLGVKSSESNSICPGGIKRSPDSVLSIFRVETQNSAFGASFEDVGWPLAGLAPLPFEVMTWLRCVSMDIGARMQFRDLSNNLINQLIWVN